MSRQFVAYYRVSTDRQGRSGLGLDAQREAVFRHLASQAGDLIGEFCEVESGRRSDRPQLAAAFAAGKMPEDSLALGDRKSTRLNSSHGSISYAVFCLKK